MEKTSVLFVCLGNICRSPAAEAIFQKLINDKDPKDRKRAQRLQNPNQLSFRPQ